MSVIDTVTYIRRKTTFKLYTPSSPQEVKMKTLIQVPLIMISSLISCTNDTNNNKQPQLDEPHRPPYTTDTSKVTLEYVATGYYLLADNLDGVMM